MCDPFCKHPAFLSKAILTLDREDEFDPAWITWIEAHAQDYIPLNIFDPKKAKQNIRPWFVFQKGSESLPVTSSYKCRLCEKYYDTMFLHPRLKPKIATKYGQMRSNKWDNKKKILNHANSLAHRMVIQGLKKREEAKLPARFVDAQRKTHDDSGIDLATTMVHFRTIFTAIKLNIPFDSYQEVLKMQSLNGISVGVNFINKCGAAKLTQFLSEQMHKIFMESIREQNQFLGVIVDETTGTFSLNLLNIDI